MIFSFTVANEMHLLDRQLQSVFDNSSTVQHFQIRTSIEFDFPHENFRANLFQFVIIVSTGS